MDQYILTTDLGSEFDLGNIQANKVRLKLGTGLAIQVDGTIIASAVYSRLIIGAQTITNTGAVLNRLNTITSDVDLIGLTIGADSITLPTGNYMIEYYINVFDNNSARVAHRSILRVDGALRSTIEGNNYLRDASAHDSSHIHHKDIVSGVVTLDLQTTSSVNNTTSITGGHILITKL